MAKKQQLISVSMADLKKMPRSEQRRYLDLGYVQHEVPEAKPEAKAK